MRRSLDAELVRRGLAVDRIESRAHIESGRVLVAGAPATNAGRQVDPSEAVRVVPEAPQFVGRGGEKLSAALDGFVLDPSGARILDAGASTGGFTDALLQRGAREVVALDVGHGQLHERLDRDPRVLRMDRTNLRYVRPDELGPFDGVVADLSFISLRTVMGVLIGLCAPGGWIVVLVKPQFEVDRRVASRGRGVVTDPEQWSGAVEGVAAAACENDASMSALMVSPLRGAEGNVEFLARIERLDPVARHGRPVPQATLLVADALERAGLASTPTAEADR